MDFKNYDTFNVLNTTSKLKIDIRQICDSIDKKLIFDISNDKWQCNSKDLFHKNISAVKDELLNFQNLLNEVDFTFKDIQKIQQLNLEIDALKQENEILKNSQLQMDKIKFIENENKINNFSEIVDQLKSNNFSKWG